MNDRDEPTGETGPDRAPREPDPDLTDATFADIVARWDEEPEWSGTARPTGPPAPDAPTNPPPSPTLPPAMRPLPETGEPDADDTELLDLDDPELLDRAGWRGYSPPEQQEHFEPPTPTLPPAHDVTYWLAVLGLTLGPLIIVWAAVVSSTPDPGWWVLLGIAATVVGFGLLVLRGSEDRDPDDNGARV
ncbi:MAG: hypothetical protein WAR57_10615 [Candidatus Phosphoribacter sp.]|nr:hypothetical protein [Actinomycetales bacterium]